MELPPQALQFVGSLAAILLLASIARWLKLGHPIRIESDEQARIAANEVLDGFKPVEVARDRAGRGALLRDDQGRIMLLKSHGSKLAGRILTEAANATSDGDTISIDTGEKQYGVVGLVLDDASAWVQAINALKTSHDA